VTIAGQVAIRNRSWRGYDDPGLPVGMYISQQSVTGDLSGGNMRINHTFALSQRPTSPRYYNIEQLEVHVTSELGATSGFLIIRNFELVSPSGLIDRQLRFVLTSNNRTVSALDFSEAPRLPIFLGITSVVPVISSEVEVGIDNIDGETLFSTIQGYIWGPRSMMAPGGLRRPVDSLYGR